MRETHALYLQYYYVGARKTDLVYSWTIQNAISNSLRDVHVCISILCELCISNTTLHNLTYVCLNTNKFYAFFLSSFPTKICSNMNILPVKLALPLHHVHHVYMKIHVPMACTMKALQFIQKSMRIKRHLSEWRCNGTVHLCLIFRRTAKRIRFNRMYIST